jgi:hypothetical protein
MRVYPCYRQWAGMAAAGLATNCSNAVARARVTNAYSGSYELRALLQNEAKTRDAKKSAQATQT